MYSLNLSQDGDANCLIAKLDWLQRSWLAFDDQTVIKSTQTFALC